MVKYKLTFDFDLGEILSQEDSDHYIDIIRFDDNCFYDLSDIFNIGDYANFCDDADDMNISKVFLVPEKNGDLYVDKASLKQYRYNEYENSKKK